MFHTILFSTSSSGTYNLTLTEDQFNFNLRNYIISQEGSVSAYSTINLIIADGVRIGASSPNSYAFDTGTLSGVTLNITNNGIISGAGGNGGEEDSDGEDAGHGMIFRLDAALVNTGLIQGGGGGGGGGLSAPGEPFINDGGGGAGLRAGTTFAAGGEGTLSSGGIPLGTGGAGGEPADPGDNAAFRLGGAAGDAIHKNGNTVTVTNSGTITGTQSATT